MECYFLMHWVPNLSDGRWCISWYNCTCNLIHSDETKDCIWWLFLFDIQWCCFSNNSTFFPSYWIGCVYPLYAKCLDKLSSVVVSKIEVYNSWHFYGSINILSRKSLELEGPSQICFLLLTLFYRPFNTMIKILILNVP